MNDQMNGWMSAPAYTWAPSMLYSRPLTAGACSLPSGAGQAGWGKFMPWRADPQPRPARGMKDKPLSFFTGWVGPLQSMFCTVSFRSPVRMSPGALRSNLLLTHPVLAVSPSLSHLLPIFLFSGCPVITGCINHLYSNLCFKSISGESSPGDTS